MTKYLYRTCPKCKDYPDVVVPDPSESMKLIPINSCCVRCGFKLGWKVVLGQKPILASFWFLFFLLFHPLSVHPHSGLLDGYGCHHDSKRGEYHCHQGVHSGKRFNSRQEMLQQTRERKPYSPPSQGERANYQTVTRVVGRDTIVLKNRKRVRLIGVDTPETKDPQKPVEFFGREATAFIRLMVQGKKVRLEFEQANAPIGHKDKYDTTLAYIFLENGTFLNAEIIKQGYGFAYARFPFKYLDEFRRYEREAREQGKGLWGKGMKVPAPVHDAKLKAEIKAQSKPEGHFKVGIYKMRYSTLVYSEPRGDSPTVTEIRARTRVNVTGVQGDWLEIRSKHGRPPGFIRKDSVVPIGSR
ncbi:MAG: thermonuclease family protein [Candidatus Binatia bacterium]